MGIASSAIIEDRPQRDGRRAIRERFVDSEGAEYFRSYLCLEGDDPTATLATRATELEAQLAAAELDADEALFFGDGDFSGADINPTYSFKFVTAAQVLVRMRVRFATATGLDALRIARVLAKLTDAQLKNLFNYTNPQTSALRTKLNNMLALIATIRSQAGE
jgi:hypothetical protein